MWPFLITGIIVLVNLYLGILVFSLNPKKLTNRLFIIIITVGILWIISNFLENAPISKKLAIFFLKTDFSLAALWAYFFLLFCVNFQQEKISPSKVKRFILFLFSIFFIISPFSNLIIKEINFSNHLLNFKTAELFPLYAFYLFLYIGGGCIELFLKYKKAEGVKRTQILFLLIGFSVSLLIALLLNLFFQGRIKLSIFRIGIYSFLFFTILTTYAIVRHRLMDIRIVAREVTVYGVSLIVSAVLCLIGLSLIMKYVLPFVPFSSSLIWLMLAISIFGIIVFQFVKEKFGQFANRWLFYPLYSFEKTIENFSKKLSRFIDLNHLVFSTTDTLKEVFKLDNIALILRKLEPPKGQLKLLGIKEESGDTFYLAKNIGFNEEEISLLIKNKFLLYYLEKNKKPLVSDELGFLAEEIKEQSLKNKFLTIKKFMEKMKAGLYLPLLIGVYYGARSSIVGFIHLLIKSVDKIF
jgi:hypothetical protein